MSHKTDRGDFLVAFRVLYPNKQIRQTGAVIRQFKKDVLEAQSNGLVEFDVEGGFVPTQKYIDYMDYLDSIDMD